MVNIRDIIQELKLIIFDVDGVFTDGSVYLNEKGKEILKFSRIDGKGVELIKKKGLKTAVISSENSNAAVPYTSLDTCLLLQQVHQWCVWKGHLLPASNKRGHTGPLLKYLQ